MSWTYNAAEIAGSQVFQVRFLLGDTNQNDQQLQDEEITFAISTRGSIFGAAAMGALSIASSFSRKADTTTGELRTLYSSQARAYAARAETYEQQATERSGGLPYCGGISIADKRNREADEDRVPPNFNRGLTDNNNQPVSPVGNETDSYGGA